MPYRIKTDIGYVSEYTKFKASNSCSVSFDRDKYKCRVFTRKSDAVNAVHRIKTFHLFQPGQSFSTIEYEQYYPEIEFVLEQ